MMNSSVIVNGGGVPFAGSKSSSIRDYSDFADTVDLTNTSPSNYHTRMMGGNDVVTLSNINTGGFSNKVNGNLGADVITSKAGSVCRDFILGGSENDIINLSNSTKGADWQNGNNGDDQIIGATSTTMSILRGGADNDIITLLNGHKHIVVGDLGTDVVNIGGTGAARIVCRTDNGAAVQNLVEADQIFQFDGNDKIYIPGINSTADLIVGQGNGYSFIKANKYTNGTEGMRFICKIYDRTKAQVEGYIAGGQVIIGDMADKAYASLTPENYLNNPDLGGLFA